MNKLLKEIKKQKILRDKYYLQGRHNLACLAMNNILLWKNKYAQEMELDKLNVRFLKEFTLALGHLGLLDSYVKMDIIGERSTATPIIIADRISNKHYLEYWRDYLPNIITNKEVIRDLEIISPFLEDHVFFVMKKDGIQVSETDYTATNYQAYLQMRWEKEKRPPLLKLTDDDLQRGYERLYCMALTDVDWFVGLHVRDDFDTSRNVRGANIDDYFEAIKAITDLGGYVVRMGDKSMKPLPKMYRVIDYATSNYREDWMDVFLFGACKFFICMQSGPGQVPPSFGVPVVATNWNYAWRRWFKDDIFILKKFYSEKEQRYLSLKECLSGYGKAEDTEYLKCHGITVIPNTPGEIKDAVSEMLDRILNIESCKQNGLNSEFENIWKEYSGISNSTISQNYLRNNAEWMLKRN